MTNYLETKICDIRDPDFQTMVNELCQCVAKNQTEFCNFRFSFMLTVITSDYPKFLSKQYLPAPGILTKKVDKLSPDSVVFDVCRELADLDGTHIEWFDGKMVLSLIKKCSKIYCPRPARARKPTRNQLRYECQTALIVRRRQCGAL